MSPLNPKFAFSFRHAVGVAMGAALLAGCNSLDVENPNAPDANRALADPAAMQAVAGGTLRKWFNTWDGMEGGGPLVTMAQAYSARGAKFGVNSTCAGVNSGSTRSTCSTSARETHSKASPSTARLRSTCGLAFAVSA